MHKTATINARIEPQIKIHAEAILRKKGLTSAQALRLFYTQVCLKKDLPFDARIPNKKTLQAMQQVEKRKTLKAKSVRALFDDLK